MKRILILPAFLAAACGSVEDRADCAASPDCPVGQYCARTPDGNVCWADAAPPSVSNVTASCDGPCRRDSLLHVSAAVADATSEVLDASVALDVGGQPVAMTKAGAEWKADVDLRRFPFEFFSHDVVVTVIARDGARNASAPATATVAGVTRLKWTYDAGAPLTSPAVMADGTVVVGVSAAADQVLAVRPDGTKAWSRTVGGTSFVTAAPAVGEHAIWVGSDDQSLHALELDGSAVKAGVGVNVGGPIKGAVALLLSGTKEWAFAASEAGFVGAASNVENEFAAAGPTSALSVGPVVGIDGRIYAATATGTLRAYRLNTAPAITLTELWNVPVGVNVAAPFAADGNANFWTGTLEGNLSKTAAGDASGVVTPVATLPGSVVDSPVLLANGDVLVGDLTGVLHRFTSAGSALWSSPPALGGAIRAPLVLSNTEATFLVPTAGGKVFALRSDGNVAWSATLQTGNALRAPNISAPTISGGAVTSTAYLTNAGGKLFALIVDGQLDASAPWPKAFHDPRNTNRAGPQP